MKIKVIVNNNFIAIKNYSPKLKTLISERFTFEDKSFVFARGSYDSKKIIKRKLFMAQKETILMSCGFLFDLLTLLKDNKTSIDLIDERIKIPYKKDFDARSYFPEEFEYTEHQEDALNAMMKTTCGIIKAPTSSGKSEIIAAYIKAVNRKTLLVTNKVDLVNQLYEVLIERGVKNVGICTGSRYIEGDVMVSTIFSVQKIPFLHKIEVLIVDETHHVCSNTYQELLFKYRGFKFRFGFSATPELSDSYKWALIRQYLGNIIYEIDAQTLMEKEILAKPKIYFIENKGRPTLDWQSGYQINITANDERNSKIKELVEDNNMRTLIIVKYIEHGEILERLINNSKFLNGSHSEEERSETVKKFKNNEIQTIIATAIFNEGISINEIQLLINAAGGKSYQETVQRLGRSLRIDKKNNKFDVVVYDFMDTDNKFTNRHSKQRINIYKKEGFEVLLP